MDGHAITMLGTGLIGDFYTNTLHGQRGRDRVRVVYSRTAERGEAFRERWGDRRDRRPTWPPRSTTPTPTSSSSALPNFLHEEAVGLAAKAGKAVLCTKPLGRTAEEARRMLEVVEAAGVFGGYLEDLCYTPKTLKAIASVAGGAIGDVTWVRSRETHPGPHSAWFWDGRLTGGGAIIDLGCHCIEIIRNFVGKGNRPVEVLCHTDTLVHPIADEDNAVALHPVRVGRDRPVRGELDVPRRDGPARRGRGHARHDLAEPLPADRVRDVLAPGGGGGYVAEKAGVVGGLAVPGRRRGVRARLRGHVQRHVPGDRRGPGAARDVLRRLRRQRDHGRGLPVGEGARLGAGRARVARRRRRRGSRRRPRRSRARSSSSARSCPTAGTS